MKALGLAIALWGVVIAGWGQNEFGEAVIPASGFEDGMGTWQRVYGSPTIDEEVSHSGTASLRLDDAGAVTTDFLE